MRFPVVNEVEAYWEGLRAGRVMPVRADIDPRGLERALSHTFIVERMAPGVVRFRLSGQHLNALMGMEVHGMPLSAFFTGDARDELGQLVAAMFDAPQIVRLTLSGERGVGKPAIEGVMLLLPLRNEAGEVTRALGCLATEGRIGRSPRRFRIAAARTRVLQPVVAARPHPTTPATGFAEPRSGFSAAPTAAQPPASPVLTLVKSDR